MIVESSPDSDQHGEEYKDDSETDVDHLEVSAVSFPHSVTPSAMRMSTGKCRVSFPLENNYHSQSDPHGNSNLEDMLR